MSALLEIRGLVKGYQALRPLRIRELVVTPGTVVSLGGLDATAAETFVHLVTGATLPDEGDVLMLGKNTRAITDGDAWLKSLDAVGMVTARGILIETFSVLQNIAMSFTLEVDPIDPRVVPRPARWRAMSASTRRSSTCRRGRPGPRCRCACTWRGRLRSGQSC